MSNITAAGYEDMLCIEGLFLFFGFYSSLVFVYEGVNIVFSEFHTTLCRLDFLTFFLILLLDEIVNCKMLSSFLFSPRPRASA